MDVEILGFGNIERALSTMIGGNSLNRQYIESLYKLQFMFGEIGNIEGASASMEAHSAGNITSGNISRVFQQSAHTSTRRLLSA